ncbi:MAG: hypothetical protein IPP83_10680 [Flavobacteriales bacterium]|nr:hypothetical protein [Flavobacteriales bacterium]
MKRKYLMIAIGAVLGAIGGWVYWSQVGCASGSCAITSHPLNSTLYGTFLGGLLGSTLNDLRKPKNTNENTH